jgi:uncharacterized membrane protein YvlD (DUF360 family)
MTETSTAEYGQRPSWRPDTPKLRLTYVLFSWLLSALALWLATFLVPGISVDRPGAALLVAALIAILNALLPPVIAALRLPFTVGLGFIVILILDAVMLRVAATQTDAMTVSGIAAPLLTVLVASAITVALQVVAGTNDDDTYTLKVIQRIARRTGDRVETDVPGILYLEIDGLSRPVLQRAMRDGSAPTMARWVADGSHRLSGWETDLSSQTGASQAGILMGSNADIPAFRWVEKESGRLMTCSAPADCIELERRHTTGDGLLRDGGASRANLLSGEADHVILTVSRMEVEKKANPGYRSFYANGYNVTRVLVLFIYEVILEWSAAIRSRRRDVRPRGHRGGSYPFVRAAMAVAVRDLAANAVLTDMMAGRPAVYACFAGYDEVAHHSGLERADALEALRKLDQQFKRIEHARAFAPRPYEIVVLSDHGQTQGATFLQRNGYTLSDLVSRSVETDAVARLEGGDENDSTVDKAFDEARGHALGDEEAEKQAGTQAGKDKKTAGSVVDQDVVVLGSGNLGLIYLMDEKRRMTLEEIEKRHPRLLPALREHPHVGWLMVRSEKHGAVALGAAGANYLDEGRVEGADPLAGFRPTAPRHLKRTDGFANAPDVLINSFYDPQLEEGCAFEELISFHGGMGGFQTDGFVLHPGHLAVPDEPIVGAEHFHDVLMGWRRELQPMSAAHSVGDATTVDTPEGAPA